MRNRRRRVSRHWRFGLLIAALVVCPCVVFAIDAGAPKAKSVTWEARSGCPFKIVYPEGAVTIIEKERLIETVDPDMKGTDSVETVVLRIKRQGAFPRTYDVAASDWPSMDPHFTFYEVEGNKTIGQIGDLRGEELTIREDGSLVVYSRTNHYFGEYSLYEIRDNEFVEIDQPFRYLGLKSKTLEPVPVYSSMTAKEPYRTLALGTEVELLMHCDDGWFVVKTDDCILGLARGFPGVTSDGTLKAAFEGLEFRGD